MRRDSGKQYTPSNIFKIHNLLKQKSLVIDLIYRFLSLNIKLHKQYKLKRWSKKDCCKQCRYVKFKGTMTKWPVQKLTHRTTQKRVQHHDATDI